MNPHDALAEGRLIDALSAQEAAVNANPDDLVARRFLIDLLAFAGRSGDALQHLAAIESDAPEWPEMERTLHRLFRSERLRSVDGREPQMRPQPAPQHLTSRWRAIKAIRTAKPDAAIRLVDAADANSPVIRGFINGYEFESLRDADDRFGSVLEAFIGGEYFWFAWEWLRKVKLTPAAVLLDQLYRPATITLKDGTSVEAHMPLIYPGSHKADGVFALGSETDHICPDGGPTRCVGGKLLLVGDDDEVPLAECLMIEVK